MPEKCQEKEFYFLEQILLTLIRNLNKKVIFGNRKKVQIDEKLNVGPKKWSAEQDELVRVKM